MYIIDDTNFLMYWWTITNKKIIRKKSGMYECIIYFIKMTFNTDNYILK